MTSYHAGISAETSISTTVLIGARFFLSLIVGFALLNSSRLFFRSHGWGHRLAGAAHLFWLFLGAWTVHHSTTSSFPTTTTATTPRLFFFGYDFILGALGILATLTAARDFPHKLVSNASGQSGTLNQTAIVTQDEMIEHSFYQLLNLLQAMYLHTLQYCYDHGAKINNGQNSLMDGDGTTRTTISITTRLILLWLVTMPWLFRHMLPVHSFSHNWKVYLKQTKTKKNETDDLEKEQQQRQHHHDSILFGMENFLDPIEYILCDGILFTKYGQGKVIATIDDAMVATIPHDDSESQCSPRCVSIRPPANLFTFPTTEFWTSTS
eukprot:scaffold10490_cov129-Cylindrotheca_fusiformis.AAC.2